MQNTPTSGASIFQYRRNVFGKSLPPRHQATSALKSDFEAKIRFVWHFGPICIRNIVFGWTCGFWSYCRDETDPIELSGVADFVADYSNDRFSAGFRPASGERRGFSSIFVMCPSNGFCVLYSSLRKTVF